MKKAQESGNSFEVLEAGVYVAKIIEYEYKDSSNGKPQIKTRWEVTQGPKAGFKGLWNYFTLTVDNPNAMAIFYRQMTALGITQDFMASLASVDPATAMKHIAGALLNRSAQIKVKVDTEWQNNKIERINPLPPGAVSETQSGGSPFPGAAAAQPAPAAAEAAPAPTPPASPSETPVAPAPAPSSLPAPPF
jgi:hypothetical protein